MNATIRQAQRSLLDGELDGRDESCGHAETEQLGWSGSVLFMRCRACGGVLVQQGRLVLFVPRKKPC